MEKFVKELLSSDYSLQKTFSMLYKYRENQGFTKVLNMQKMNHSI